MNVTKKVKVEKLASFTGHRDCVYTVEPGVLPYLIYSAAGDGMVACWNLQNPDQGELIARIPASVYALHYLADKEQLWIGQNFDGVHVINLQTKQEIKSVKITSASIFDIKSWGHWIFVGTGDGQVIVMDRENYAVVRQLHVSAKSARCIAINPLQQELAVGYSDNFIRIFDLHTLKIKHVIEAHTNSVFTLTYSKDYQYLLSGSRDAHLKVWQATAGYTLHQSIVAHMYAVNHIAYNPTGDYFVTGSMDKSIKVWDAHTFKLLKVIDKARHAGHGTSINKLLWTDYENQVVSASDDRTLSVWKLSVDT